MHGTWELAAAAAAKDLVRLLDDRQGVPELVRVQLVHHLRHAHPSLPYIPEL